MVLDIVTLAVTVPVLALALAHVLEWPGKNRLDPRDYLLVQRIYFPGFTVAGMLTELPALGLAVAGTIANGASALRLSVLVALAAVNLVFWLVVQPVNRRRARSDGNAVPDPAGRLRWELGHTARAVAAGVALGALVAIVAR